MHNRSQRGEEGVGNLQLVASVADRVRHEELTEEVLEERVLVGERVVPEEE